MGISREEYKILKSKAERELKNYPYYLISLETPGLGSATRWDLVYEKSNCPSSKVEGEAIDNDYRRRVIHAIEYVIDRLDNSSKKIIETSYFREDITREEVQEELKIDRNRYYRLKKNSLEKFILALAYI